MFGQAQGNDHERPKAEVAASDMTRKDGRKKAVGDAFQQLRTALKYLVYELAFL